tara:strand:- start:1425 stop:1646 length:222 start_codon:yes stop_codon:yes gene_type:complete
VKEFGKWLFFIGIFTSLAGLIVYYFNSSFNWLGKLPGDIRLGNGNVRFYFPVTTLIIINVLIFIFIRIYNILK